MSVGLYAYPVLMAADILAYNASHVPVGEDQKQHIELSRDIAQKFNIDYKRRIYELTGEKEFFLLPEPLINGPVPRVMSLRDGTKKMSSSELSDMTRINMLDSDDTIASKIKKAKTDSGTIPSQLEELEERPELKNLINIYAGINNQLPELVLQKFSGGQFSNLKNELTDLLISKICPIGDEMRRIQSDEAYLEKVLEDGAEKARNISEPILNNAKKIMGLT